MTGPDPSAGSPRVVVLVGNPKAGSRTRQLAEQAAAALVPTAAATTVDIATLAAGLLVPWQLSDQARAAVDQVLAADLVVLGTPTYKASYPGVLKLFLDTFAAESLAATVVQPVITVGGPVHRHLVDIHLRPVLTELGALTPVPSLISTESEIADFPALLDEHVRRFGPVLTGVLDAVTGSAVTTIPTPAVEALR